jgi:putative transposase
MARRLRVAPGGVVYHVLNRAVGRATLFDDDGDYAAFEKVLAQAHDRTGTRLIAYCVMPNHWHLVVWPRRDGELSQYMRWLQVTHTQRWHSHHGTSGTGPLYQGRFKSFPVQQDEHFLVVCRYVERNPLRATLVVKATDWHWSSLGHRAEGRGWLLSPEQWPVPPPDNWRAWIESAQTDAELARLRTSVRRGQPFGSPAWQSAAASRLRLQSSLRAPHRPRGKRSRKKDS